MVIIGVDPGSVITGYAVIKKRADRKEPFAVIDFGCIITEKHLGTGGRLEYIHKEISKLLAKHKPHVMSVENVFFFRNLTTAMPVSQTKGVILLAAQQHRIPVMEFTPPQMKLAIAGHGKAEKKQVQKMIEETVSLSHLDIKKKFRKKDDAFDAIGIALCAAIKSY